MDEKSVMWSRKTIIRGRTRGPLKVMRRTATARASGGSLVLGDVTVVAPLREVAVACRIDNTFVENAAKSNG
jgi:hypothetical protein